MTSVAVQGGIASKNSTRTAWIVTALQFGYAAWFGFCVWAALTRAADFAGHIYVPYQGDPYTENADIWSGSWSGLAGPLELTASVYPFVFFASLGFSIWQLALASTRRNKILFSLLLTSAILVLATFVLGVTPAGQSIAGWILD